VLLHQIHRVAQTLRDGVIDDPELTADLALAATKPDTSEQDEEAEDTNDTAPEPFDPIAMANLRGADTEAASDHSHTTAIEQLPAPAAAADARLPAPRKPSTPVPVITTARRRSVKGPVSFLLVVLLLAGVAVGSWWFGYARYTTTPGVLGVTEAAATSELDRAGLSVDVGTPRYSETVEAGLVLGSDPEPGERVLKDGSVTLVVSLGPERYDVPALKGMTEDQAQDALAQTSLVFGDSVEKFSESAPAGSVMRSDPRAGTTVKPDTPVDLVVSKGRRPIEISDWTGEDADKAIAAMEKRKLVVEVTGEEFSDSVAEGDVISQSPTTGPLFKGDTVELVVSKGPELVEVPRVIAMGVDAATERLEALGFQVVVENSDSYIGVGFVFSTSPGAGDMVAKGSTITLYLI
jgi:serine/threonine-protein kinase